MQTTQKYTLKPYIINIFIVLLFTINLNAQSMIPTVLQVQKQENSSQIQSNNDETTDEVNPYDIGFILHLIKNKGLKPSTEQHIEKIDDEMAKIIKNINQEVYYPFDLFEYEKTKRFLSSKININSKYDNNLAVLRDELKIIILENKKNFAQVVNAIIDGKNSFKDKKYFITLLENTIKKLKQIDLSTYQTIGLEVAAQKDSLSVEFKTSLDTLTQQIKADLFVFTYLSSNMNQYRPSNIILDELSLKYVIEKIDSQKYIKNISSIFHYYFHISIGKIVVLFGIFLLFFAINRKVLPFLGTIIEKKFSKKFVNLDISLFDLLPPSFRSIVSIILYIFAIQIAVYLLVENTNSLNYLIPWFSTIYLALFAYMLYRVLNNYINLSSDKLFSDHPNMRKEMVDFLLRILKVVILIFLLFFLLIQLDFDIKAIIASLGIGGIAIALAAKDTLSNFFGSLNIITDNSFSQGDWIEAGSVEGTVVDIRMRTTRIRTFANAMITVPNAQLANMSIMNWSKRVIGRRIKMSLGITYNSKMSDIEKLVEDIREMLQEHPLIATSRLNIDKKPYLLKKEDLIGIKNNVLVYIDEYAGSSINIFVYCFSRSPVWEDWLETKQDVMVKISDLVEKNNCAFAFPTQTIYMEKSEELKQK
ncbi:MAG: mechanosensitive ion channel family protein [Arcobacteraceae bacterium]